MPNPLHANGIPSPIYPNIGDASAFIAAVRRHADRAFPSPQPQMDLLELTVVSITVWNKPQGALPWRTISLYGNSGRWRLSWDGRADCQHPPQPGARRGTGVRRIGALIREGLGPRGSMQVGSTYSYSR